MKNDASLRNSLYSYDRALYSCPIIGVQFTLAGMLQYLGKKWEESGLKRAAGKGCRKSDLQKEIEALEEYQRRHAEYEKKFKV